MIYTYLNQLSVFKYVRNGGNLNVREMNVRKRTIPVRSENDTPIL